MVSTSKQELSVYSCCVSQLCMLVFSNLPFGHGMCPHVPVTLISGQLTSVVGDVYLCVCLVSSCASYTGLWPVDFGSGVYMCVCV